MMITGLPFKSLITLMALSTTLESRGDWMSICPPKAAEMGSLVVEGPESQLDGFRISNQRNPSSQCTDIEVPFTREDVEWIKLVSSSLTMGIDAAQALTLTGSPREGLFSGDLEIASESPSHTRSAVTLNRDLRSLIPIRPFGIEERAQAFRDKNALVLACNPGKKPAGFLLPLSLPDKPSANSLLIRYQSDTPFELGIQKDGPSDEEPLVVRHLDAAPASPKTVMTPATHDSKGRLQKYVVICPANDPARLTIERISLTGEKGVMPKSRATWLWDAARWEQADERLWMMLDQAKIQTLFINIPLLSDLSAPKNEAELIQFLQQAHQRGLEVLAVDGDPQAIKKTERATWQKRVMALQQFNDRQSPEHRLDGLQLDIEPYINNGYGFAPHLWNQAYLETIKTLKQSTSLRLEVVIPFWWISGSHIDPHFMEQLAHTVSAFTVMAYRTDPSEIFAIADDAFRFAEAFQLPVRIAIEAGPIKPEVSESFRRTQQGELLHYRLGNASVFVRTSRSFLDSKATVFTSTHKGLSDPGRTTFAEKRSLIPEVVAELEEGLSDHSTFEGISIHEYLQFSEKGISK